MPITLTVTAGPHAGRTFIFQSHDTFLVGRADEAHFSLPDDPYFSRMHFLVEVNPPLCRLTDLGSHNGTLVNGQKVQTADLHHGDEIRGGKTVLRVSVAVPAAPTLDMPAPASPAPTSVPPLGGETLDLPVHRSIPPPLPGGIFTRSTSDLPALLGYHLLGELGRGGMGVVYRGSCEADGSVVAIKTIRPGVSPTPVTVARFLREAAILKELNHPNVVGFRDTGEAGGLLFINDPLES